MEVPPLFPFPFTSCCWLLIFPSCTYMNGRRPCTDILVRVIQLMCEGSADTHVVPQVVLAARPRPRGASADHLDVMPTARTILAATQRKTAAGDSQKKKKARSSSRAVKRDSIRKRAQSLTRADGEEHTTTTTSEAGGSPAVDDGASPSAGGHQASRRRRRLPKVPELALRGLIEMGFTAGRARKVPHLLCASMPCLASMLAHLIREWCRPCC